MAEVNDRAMWLDLVKGVGCAWVDHPATGEGRRTLGLAVSNADKARPVLGG